jgi:adenosylmethionine-8-amino-7-oxononanoate aminotransferase
VLYLLPPYCITEAELEWVYQTIETFLKDWENIQTKEPIHPGAIYG